MKISQVKLIGFRNYKNAIINLEEKTLVIGANDVGKSNLLYSLRMLLDRSISDQNIEPKDSDFYAFENTNYFSITLKFSDVSDGVRATFKEAVSDDGELFLKYEATRDSLTGKKEYSIYAGYDEANLEERESRSYTKALNIRYISSYRDLNSYIKGEKKRLMEDAKESRIEDEINSDLDILNSVKSNLASINSKISNLAYIKKATVGINQELEKLSYHHTNHHVKFSIGGYDVQSYIDDAQLSSEVNGENLNIGGDGRNNQIFLALWSAKNAINPSPSIITIFAIEEPEAHLHPQQQRKLAEYLVKKIESQVIITSHSPHILSSFSPNSIVRLFQKESSTIAANNGCAQIIDEAYSNFGYRRSIISEESFFCNVVLLVEGASEIVFYTALGKSLFELDKYNIGIMMADGVGFEPFVTILKALEIPFVLRTDNDVFKVPRSTPSTYYCSGINRGFSIIGMKPLYESKYKKYVHAFSPKLPLPIKTKKAVDIAISFLERKNIFIADVDLETDLANSPCSTDLNDHYGTTTTLALIEKMKEHKGGTIFSFLAKYPNTLKKLTADSLSDPLKRCKKIAKKIIK